MHVRHNTTIFIVNFISKTFYFYENFHIFRWRKERRKKKSTKTAIEKLLKYFVLQLHETYNTISVFDKIYEKS